jgi:hypothetical protein
MKKGAHETGAAFFIEAVWPGHSLFTDSHFTDSHSTDSLFTDKLFDRQPFDRQKLPTGRLTDKN